MPSGRRTRAGESKHASVLVLREDNGVAADGVRELRPNGVRSLLDDVLHDVVAVLVLHEGHAVCNDLRGERAPQWNATRGRWRRQKEREGARARIREGG